MSTYTYDINQSNFFSEVEFSEFISLMEENIKSIPQNFDKYGIAELEFYINKLKELCKPDYKIKIGLIGSFSSGKTTIVNSFLGFELGKTGDMPITKKVFKIKYDPDKVIQEKKSKIEIVMKNQKSSHRLFDYDAFKKEVEGKLLDALIDNSDYCNAFINKNDLTANNRYPIDDDILKKIEIIDTPGYDSNRGTDHVEAVNILPELDIVIYVKKLSSLEVVGDADIDFIRENNLMKKDIVFLFNCADMDDQDEINEKLKNNKEELKKIFPEINKFFVIDGKKAFEIKALSTPEFNKTDYKKLIDNNILSEDLNELIIDYISKYDYCFKKIKYRILNNAQKLFHSLIFKCRKNDIIDTEKEIKKEHDENNRIIENQISQFQNTYKYIFKDRFSEKWFKEQKDEYEQQYKSIFSKALEFHNRFFEMLFNSSDNEICYTEENAFNVFFKNNIYKHYSELIDFVFLLMNSLKLNENVLKHAIDNYIQYGDFKLPNSKGFWGWDPLLKEDNKKKLKDHIIDIKYNSHNEFLRRMSYYYSKDFLPEVTKFLVAKIKSKLKEEHDTLINTLKDENVNATYYYLTKLMDMHNVVFKRMNENLSELDNTNWDNISVVYNGIVESNIYYFNEYFKTKLESHKNIETTDINDKLRSDQEEFIMKMKPLTSF